MKSFLIALSLTALVFACNAPKGSGGEKAVSVGELKDEVMDTHDEVMPKMGELRKVRKQLEALASSRADSLQGTNDSLASRYQGIASELAAANEGMMDWMRNYEPNFEGTEEEQREYLLAQKEKIEKVKAEMLDALEKGKVAVGNNAVGNNGVGKVSIRE